MRVRKQLHLAWLPRMANFSRIPKDEQERQLYREVASAYRNARRQGGPPHVCYWSAAAVVQRKRPKLSQDEAGSLGAQIVRTVGMEYPQWFWK
jgi:hypothetical protein